MERQDERRVLKGANWTGAVSVKKGWTWFNITSCNMDINAAGKQKCESVSK